jgi:lambda repressor-like predicted transcriptional regulator
MTQACNDIKCRHEGLKARLRDRGHTLVSIADELGVTRASVTNVAKGKDRSRRIETRIAELCGLSPAQIWPHRDNAVASKEGCE